MYRLYCVLFSLFFIVFKTAHANELALILDKFNHQLEQHHFSAQLSSYSKELNQSRFTYIQGVGAIFHLEYRQPFYLWEQTNEDKNRNELPQYVAQIAHEQAKETFNQLRVKAKNLSHQAYSLERQIKSMRTSIDSLSGAEREERLAKIEQAQTELKLVSTEKQMLIPKYEHAKALVNASTESNTDNEESYLNKVEHFIATQLCTQFQISAHLQPSDKLLFILKSTGNNLALQPEKYRTQDTIYAITKNDLAKCESGEINTGELLNNLSTQIF